MSAEENMELMKTLDDSWNNQDWGETLLRPGGIDEADRRDVSKQR